MLDLMLNNKNTQLTKHRSLLPRKLKNTLCKTLKYKLATARMEI